MFRSNLFYYFVIPLLTCVECSDFFQCGQRQVSAPNITIAASDTYRGQWPWHVAIYLARPNQRLNYTCAGTLIGTKYVLTASQCTRDQNGNEELSEKFFIRLGAYDLGRVNRNVERYRTVQRIHRALEDERELVEMADDVRDRRVEVAILELETHVRFTRYVQPACVHPQAIFFTNATVIGWRSTTNHSSSAELRNYLMPILDDYDCLYSEFGPFFREMPWCVGYPNGTGLCYGDVGGGLYNVVDGMWHVIGVLFEAPPKANDHRCVTKSYALYNSVDYYKQFILKYTGLSYLDRDKTTINATDLKSSPKRSNLFPKQCGNFIPNKQPDSEDVHTMEQPWLAIIGRKDYTDKDPSFYCLGSLINKRYVLTSAACIYRGSMNTVRLGENSLNKIKNCSVNPEPDCILPAQDFEVQYHIHHESYDEKNQIHDIGLTRLLKDVVYQDHIQPVCLPVTDDLKKQQLSQYVLAGWHEGWNTFLSFVKPQKKTVQRMELTECLEQRKSLNSSIKLFEDAIFCTNDTVHFSKCIGYGGEPLGYPVQHYNERYVQFGIRSFRDDCRFFSLVYTNISYYMDWIEANMKMDAPQEGRALLKRKGTDFLIRS